MNYLKFAKESIQTAHESFSEEEEKVVKPAVDRQQIKPEMLFTRLIQYSLQSGIAAGQIALAEEVQKLNEKFDMIIRVLGQQQRPAMPEEQP